MRRSYTSIILVIIILSTSLVLIDVNDAEAEPLTEEEVFIGIDYEFPTFSLNSTMNITMDTTLPFNKSSLMAFQYELSARGLVGLVGDWMEATEFFNNSGNVSILTTASFNNGNDNWIRFKVVNESDHVFISDGYNIWVDARGPVIRLISHSEEEYQLNPRQEIGIRCEDVESGVNASTVQYRYSTTGMDNLTDWLIVPDLENGHNVEVLVELLFSRGDQNFIQVRAADIAGNNITFSKIYNIKVNTIPTPVLVSPTPDGYYQEDVNIRFDSTESYDLDGDRLEHIWYFSMGEEEEILGETQVVKVLLKPGFYNITLKLIDRVGNFGWLNFSITVNETVEPEPEPEQDPFEDVDGDGMPYFYEVEYGFKLLEKDGHEDQDYDGYSNLQEYENGTNPLDINSHPPPYLGDSNDGSTEEQTILSFWTLMIGCFVIAILLAFACVAVIMILVMKKKDPEG